MMMKLSDVDLLEALERPESAPLREMFSVRRVARGQGIFWPDEQEDLVLVVKSGRFRVYLSYGGKEFTLAFLERGDIYSSHTGAHVQALADGEMLLADTRAFRRRMTDLPEVSAIMVRVLGQMLRSTFFLIEGLVFRDSNTRLASLLLEQAERAPAPDPDDSADLDNLAEMDAEDGDPTGAGMASTPDGVPPHVPANAPIHTPVHTPAAMRPAHAHARRHAVPTRSVQPGSGQIIRMDLTTEQLAGMVGATRQTVSTLLNDMIRSGILERVGRGAYRVRDMDRLRELASA
ncbi:Crp/Fnr family transcriptional regulator [Nitratidesulfovibrio sp. SRB-5]|uniref:Crp/Fnr family transcriptional regulator n=1 Tax=Nitratidesulfovibrio sp. SRB-5 TaxID=2872636 RepID=UPI00102643DD|nr:Crp/Fnr family transcriptional regulator [Nitratidesulfovibrio sp. SRB-5]MBZ2172761.1 Crp/Fnr family transcriptional regulator [Nitratidesulfovibrio sp. SRB-5]RXF76504.1 Crp/Fnr family transcriptional regulator [Desulfovibrio sp. DS-1]